jgi:hypothetical protein
LVDLDGDGHKDILSGSWPGELYFFHRQADGSFAPGVTLTHPDGKPIQPGHASSAFATDWDADGQMDLIVGNLLGSVVFLPGQASKGKGPLFGKPVPLQAGGKPIAVNGDAAPVVADWDSDGTPDLIVGAEEGRVVWYRNIGKRGRPELQGPRLLLGKSPRAEGVTRREGEWGTRVKPCVVDFDGDGQLDLLLGDCGGGFVGKPETTKTERTEETTARALLPRLREQWAETFRTYREAKGEEADELRSKLVRLKDEIARVQDIRDRYKEQSQTHGYVWWFRRQTAR